MVDIPEFDFLDIEGDFSQIMEENVDNKFKEYKAGDKLTGKVTMLTENSVFLNIQSTSEGIIPRTEFEKKEIAVGDEVEAYFLSDSEGEIVLTTKMTGDALIESLAEAFTSQIPVEGKVVEERKGGYTVKLANIPAFCPFSQMDRARGEASDYIGNTYTFLITKYGDRDLVVSRRAFQDIAAKKRLEELKDELEEGDTIPGTIERIVDFGVFVDLDGISGLIPMNEISWSRNFDVTQLVNVGDRVEVQVLRLDWEKERISLSLRSAQNDPWENAHNYHPDQPYQGTVSKKMDFGIFVELEPGLDGLLHISKLDQAHFEKIEEGEKIEIYIDTIDTENGRISLDLEPSQSLEGREASGVTSGHSNAVKVGNKLTGTVESIKNYGAFIKLNDTKTGLLHVSTLDLPPQANALKEIEKQFEIGKEIEVEVLRVEGTRISLALPGSSAEAESQASISNYMNAHKKDSSSFGSLGGAFDSIEF